LSIHLLQLATAAAWFLAALAVAPGTFRLFFRRKTKPGDPSKGAFFFAALIFVGGSSRFLLAPDNITAWRVVYCMSILLAAYVVVIVWNMRRDA
jgi:hypothetical protein